MGRNPAPRAPRISIGRLRRRLAGERGVTLIETVIAAAILVVVVGAVLATLDTASSATASNRGRTVAAALAEQDQEQLRAMRTEDLASLGTDSEEVTVGTVKYTVVSDAKWVRDATSGEPNCTNSSRQSEYLQLTSTVTSNVVGKKIKPVQLRSLIAPHVGDGTLAVRVANQADAGVPGIPVTISGPATASGVTNAQGCAVFGHIDPGTYTIRATTLNYVDPAGRTTAETTGTVTAGTVNVTTVRYAHKASVTINFETKVGATTQPATSLAATATNAGIPSPGVRGYTVPTPVPALVATDLFPFTDGYGFYSGACASAKPTLYVPNYYTAGNPGSVTVGPGGSASVTVREPALNIRVTRANESSGAPVFAGARVLIKSTDACCSDRYEFVGGLTANGGLVEPGLPFGHYSVCADDTTVVSSTNVRNRTVNVTLDNPAGSALQTVWIDSNRTINGKCT